MEQDQLIVISGRTEPFTYQTLNAAINYAVKVYSGETLEDSLIPYIVHPFEVMNTLSFMGAGMALMAAGVLHDVVENKKVELEKIAEMFGKEISDLVAFQTDYNKDLPWKERKGITLKLLEKASQREKMLVLADELSNIEAMARCYEQWRDEFYWEIYQKNREDCEHSRNTECPC